MAKALRKELLACKICCIEWCMTVRTFSLPVNHIKTHSTQKCCSQHGERTAPSATHLQIGHSKGGSGRVNMSWLSSSSAPSLALALVFRSVKDMFTCAVTSRSWSVEDSGGTASARGLQSSLLCGGSTESTPDDRRRFFVPAGQPLVDRRWQNECDLLCGSQSIDCPQPPRVA